MGCQKPMECTSCEPSDSNRTAPAALLANLPSRGLFSSTYFSSKLILGGLTREDERNKGRDSESVKKEGAPEYLCDRDTLPPGDQVIKTNQQNILIRSLTLKKHKSDLTSKGAAADKKRAAERGLDNRAPAKRASNQSTSRQEGSSRGHEKDLQSLTVERLRLLLREKGLSPKGKKDELIARLRSVNDQA